MSHKSIVKIAIAMIVIFGLTVVVYPLLFNPDEKSRSPVAAPAPVAVPAAPAVGG